MSNDGGKAVSAADEELEREIRKGRSFSPQEAIGRLAGAGAMKGASVISRQQQAENEIGSLLTSHVSDATGVLQTVLYRQLKGSELLLNNIDRPLIALASHCERLLASDQLLEETVREADVEWGRAMGEGPHFQRDGSAPHPDDPYTVGSVRNALLKLAKQSTA